MAGKTHNVAAGDWIAKIAYQYGCDPEQIWDDEVNETLMNKRDNPNLLCVGDKVKIPEPEKKQESRPTEATHRFRVKRKSSAKLHVKLRDFPNTELETEYELEIGEQTFNGTSSDGSVEHDIPIQSHGGVLRLPKLETHLTIRVGELAGLEPWQDSQCNLKAGQARLNNLSFKSGPVDGIKGPKTRAGVRNFQTWCERYSPDNGLAAGELSSVDGHIGASDQSKTGACLKKVYGM